MAVEIKLCCIVCKASIPVERIAKGASTCGKECKAQLKKIRRALVDERRCRFCHRPSTPEERHSYGRWRRDGADIPIKRRGRASKGEHPVQHAP